jgi:DNA-binding NarL/FixJ family response regulator
VIDVLIADDHPVFIEGLKNVLPLKDQRISVVAVAADGEEAFHRWQAVRPDVTLMDIRMPDVDGIGAAKRIRERDPDARIIVLTTFDDYDLIAAALSVGVQGFLLKDSDPGEIADAIVRVVDGTFVVSLQISRRIQQRQDESDGERVVEDPFRSLTARER